MPAKLQPDHEAVRAGSHAETTGQCHRSGFLWPCVINVKLLPIPGSCRWRGVIRSPWLQARAPLVRRWRHRPRRQDAVVVVKEKTTDTKRWKMSSAPSAACTGESRDNGSRYWRLLAGCYLPAMIGSHDSIRGEVVLLSKLISNRISYGLVTLWLSE